MKDIIVIVGPTGIGKTKLSIELAKKLNGEIINGDSVSIYKELNIGSAKPTIEEQEEVPHHLINIRHIYEDYSVYDYQQDGRKIIEDINNRNKRVIIVGGTGLYIKALLYDYNFNKEEKKYNFSNYTNIDLYNEILKYDNNIDIHINNRQRLERYLTKCLNNTISSNNKNKLLYNITIIGLTTDRNSLYSRINNRVDIMIKNGLINEIEALKDYYKTSRILNSGIGYKEFTNYFNHTKNKEEVIEEIKLNSRHYAKRQYTFFNNQFNVKWYTVDLNNFNNTINTIYNDIKNKE